MQSGRTAEGKCNLSGTTLSRDNLSKYYSCNWNSNCSIYGGSSKDENDWCLLPQQRLGLWYLTDQNPMEKIHQPYLQSYSLCPLRFVHCSSFAERSVRNFFAVKGGGNHKLRKRENQNGDLEVNPHSNCNSDLLSQPSNQKKKILIFFYSLAPARMLDYPS